MKNKWNWGIGIAVVYTGFVMIRVITIIISERNDVDLVAPDYYDREIKFEERIQAIHNAKALEERVMMKRENETVIISFPVQFNKNEIQGNIVLFRPSDKRMDKTYNLQLDSNRRQMIFLSGLESGYWKIQLSWQDHEKKYYEEFPLVFKSNLNP